MAVSRKIFYSIKDHKPLTQLFYNRPAKVVAQELLGKIIRHQTRFGLLSGYIVETESYGGKDDPASHAYKKITPRNSVMFGPPGMAYVYLCYGTHFLFNIITEEENIPSAVLIRALQPLEGIETMKKLRGKKDISELTNGPGKFTRALYIDKTCNKKPVFSGKLLVTDSDYTDFKVQKATRIGITAGAEKLFRFYIKNNEYVSVK